MTRKKVRQSIDAVMTRMCPYCGGKGVVLSEETVAGRVRREIRRTLANSQCEAMLVEVHPSVASHLIGPGGSNLKDLEEETGRSIFIRGSESLHLEEMNVKALGTRQEISLKAIPLSPATDWKSSLRKPTVRIQKTGLHGSKGTFWILRTPGPKWAKKLRLGSWNVTGHSQRLKLPFLDTFSAGVLDCYGYLPRE